jgi:protein-S-isoprenylcysteine O-methyltransferase Ste14
MPIIVIPIVASLLFVCLGFFTAMHEDSFEFKRHYPVYICVIAIWVIYFAVIWITQ